MDSAVLRITSGCTVKSVRPCTELLNRITPSRAFPLMDSAMLMTAALESSMGRPCILPDTSQQSSMLAELYSTFSRLYSEI